MRNVNNVENYGGNSKSSGYTNMVDLGELAKNAGDSVADSSAALQTSISDAVVYKVAGAGKSSSQGLSIYYPLDGDADNVANYGNVTASDTYECLITYLATGSLPENTDEIVAAAQEEAAAYEAAEEETEEVAEETSEETYEEAEETYEDTEEYEEAEETYEDTEEYEEAEETSEEEEYEEFSSANVSSLEGFSGENTLEVDEDGYLNMTIDPDQLDSIESVTFGLYYFIDDETDDLLELGWDNDIDQDWDNGIFKDDFRGVWGSLNGSLCYMELMSEEDDCNLYSVPVKLNDDDSYYLVVSYDYNSDKYEVLGARRAVDEETGMADKNMYQPVEGDVIEPILYVWAEDSEDDEAITIDSITVDSEGLTFEETDLPSGDYAYCFCIEDVCGNYTYSDYAYINVDENGDFSVELGEE